MVAGDGSGALSWKTISKKEAYRAKVFTVFEQTSMGPNGKKGTFSVLEASDWAVVVPVVEKPEGDQFLMVRQYRHGADCVSLEFPGGVIEKGESPEAAAARELAEETGWTSSEIYALGSVCPNPAVQSNHFHIFIAMNPHASSQQALDENEIIDAIMLPAEEIRQRMGKGELCHALMVTALFFADRFLSERVRLKG
ncbi:MAG: NUDIX hydrolase [Spirochaetaceae bacterium]|nr:NUDIX hydrolase [Spirochaetaceae bacterium]